MGQTTTVAPEARSARSLEDAAVGLVEMNFEIGRQLTLAMLRATAYQARANLELSANLLAGAQARQKALYEVAAPAEEVPALAEDQDDPAAPSHEGEAIDPSVENAGEPAQD